MPLAILGIGLPSHRVEPAGQTPCLFTRLQGFSATFGILHRSRRSCMSEAGYIPYLHFGFLICEGGIMVVCETVLKDSCEDLLRQWVVSFFIYQLSLGTEGIFSERCPLPCYSSIGNSLFQTISGKSSHTKKIGKV